MAFGQSNEFKFVGKLFFTAFGAFALALFMQRKELNKYGYDLYARETDINAPDLTQLNILNPQNENDRNLKGILDKFKNDQMSHQVYLSRASINPAGHPRAGQPNIDPAVVKDTPMLVKCNDGSVWAYVNDNRDGADHGKVIAQRIPQNDPARWGLYKDLHFPPEGVVFSPDREKRGRGVVKNITNTDIVKDLQTNAHHLHVSKNNAHKDSRMDNRFLLLKNQVAAGQAPQYYVYAQDRNGVYHLRPARGQILAILQGQEIEYTKDKHGQIARNKELISKLLDPTQNGGHHITAENSRFTPAQLAAVDAAQRQKTMFFSGGVAAVVGVQQAPQLFNTASYAIMNKMHGEGSLKDKINKQLDPLRRKFNLGRNSGG